MAEEQQPQKEEGATRGRTSADSARGQQSPNDDGRGGRNEAQPPFRRPPDPCCGCCGSIRRSVIVWDIIFWVYGLLLILCLCFLISDKSVNVSILGYISFCGQGPGSVYSAVAATFDFLVGVTLLTVAIFASRLSPQLRIWLTKAFYLLLFPLFFVLSVVVLIMNIVESCYDFSSSNNIIRFVINLAFRLVFSGLFVLKGLHIGRAAIYCIQVESFYANNAIAEEGQ